MRFVTVCLAVVFLSFSSAAAQETLDHPVGSLQAYVHDSGAIANLDAARGLKHQHVVLVKNAAWLRLHFNNVQLEKGSYVRVTSLLDNETQILDAANMALWGNTSAYFNGDSVQVELVADGGTNNNRFAIFQLERELLPADEPRGSQGQCGICGITDDRVPSSENWTSRLFPAGCTASVWNEDSCMVSAGHCIGGSMVVQFNVPASLANCSTVNPPVADQFPITATSFTNGGVGNDWAVLTPGTNGLGELPYERYGDLRPISPTVAGIGQTSVLTGYGVDQTCTRSQTQQTHSGPISSVFSNYYRFSVDLRGGNSGSSLLRNNQIIGIATHCPCPNIATRIDLPAFVQARLVLCGNLPEPPNNNCADAIPFNNGNGDGIMPYSTLGATTDGPINPIGACNDSGSRQTGRDIWYTYEATCTGSLTVTTCDDLHGAGDATYDTDLVVYGPYDDPGQIDCANAALAAKRLGCNDDDPNNSCGTAPPWASTVIVNVTQGQTYLLRVGGFGEGDAGDGFLSVECDGVTVTGACCYKDGSCEVLRPTQCAAAGGEYQGDNTDCDPNPCPPPCNLLGDVNQDTVVDGLDVRGFVRAKLGLPEDAGDNHACADYGTGTLEGDTDEFVADLLGL